MPLDTCHAPLHTATDTTSNTSAHADPEHATIVCTDRSPIGYSDGLPIRTPDSGAIVVPDGCAKQRPDANADDHAIVRTNERARALTDASTIGSTVCERADVCDLGMHCVERHLLFIRRELSGGGRGLSRGRLRERLMRLL